MTLGEIAVGELTFSRKGLKRRFFNETPEQTHFFLISTLFITVETFQLTIRYALYASRENI